jgi:hypothetical protein
MKLLQSNKFKNAIYQTLFSFFTFMFLYTIFYDVYNILGFPPNKYVKKLSLIEALIAFFILIGIILLLSMSKNALKKLK